MGKLTPTEKLSRLDAVATSRTLNQLMYGAAKASMLEQVQLGRMIKEIKELLTDDVLEEIACLQGCNAGFRTDKEHGHGYTPAQLRMPILEAIVHGYRCVGNEFNVIGGNFYRALNGLERKVREYPGLTDLNITTGLPAGTKHKDAASVPVIATYKIDGEAIRHDWTGDRSLLVRKNAGMIGAALAGKATRQALLRIWKSLGHDVGHWDERDEPGPDQPMIDEIEQQGMTGAGVNSNRGELFDGQA